MGIKASKVAPDHSFGIVAGIKLPYNLSPLILCRYNNSNTQPILDSLDPITINVCTQYCSEILALLF